MQVHTQIVLVPPTIPERSSPAPSPTWRSCTPPSFHRHRPGRAYAANAERPVSDLEAAQVIRDHRAWRERLRELLTDWSIWPICFPARRHVRARRAPLRGHFAAAGERHRPDAHASGRLEQAQAPGPLGRHAGLCGSPHAARLIAPTLRHRRRMELPLSRPLPGRAGRQPPLRRVRHRLLASSLVRCGCTLRQEDAGDLALLPRFDASGRMTPG